MRGGAVGPAAGLIVAILVATLPEPARAQPVADAAPSRSVEIVELDPMRAALGTAGRIRAALATEDTRPVPRGVLQASQLSLTPVEDRLPAYLSVVNPGPEPRMSATKVAAAGPRRSAFLTVPERLPRGYERAPVMPFAEGRRNYLVPALETVVFNFGLLALNNFVGQQEFARVRWDDIVAHFDGRAGWTFDVDYFPINQLGHPYQGALAHTAARSSGLSFWEGFLYATASSLLWELFLERDPPSINDQITTPLAGVFLGEALHRSFRFLIDDARGRNSTLNRIAASVLSPASAFNHWLFEDQMDRRDFSALATHLGVMEAGVSLATTIRSRAGATETGLFRQGPQIFLGGDLNYGVPTDDDRDYTVPFSHYVVSADVAFPRTLLANLFIRGLLTGQRYGSETENIHGLWGLYGLYDLSANHTVRVSTVGIGLGTTLRARVGGGNQIHLTAVGGTVGFGAAGSLGLESVHERDYQIGPGVNAILEAAFVRPGLGGLAVKGRTWNIVGLYTEPRDGSEWISYVSLEGRVRILPRVSVGFDLPLMTRVYRLAGSPAIERVEIGANPRLILSFSSDDILFTESP